jgi:threonine dehydrogenase-like Zn-dependent dehydrogenase
MMSTRCSAAASRPRRWASTPFTFAQMDEAYDVFKNAAENSALKVVITPA